MVYRQNRIIKKFIELGVVFALMIAIDQYFDLQLLGQQFNVFFLVTLLMALRYGLALGSAAFSLTLLYEMFTAAQLGQDLFLLYYAPEEAVRLVFFAVMTTAAGLFSSGYRERYESLHYRNEEIRDENEYLNDTIGVLSRSQKELKQKVLESEYSLPKFFEVGLALDQPHPELIRSEAIRIFSSMFRSSEIAIYHVDKSKKSMRLLIRKKTEEEFPQTFWLDHSPSTVQRFFEKPGLTIKNVTDDQECPFLLAPIYVYGQVSEVVVFRKLPFSKLTKFDMQVLETVLKWISTRYEKARIIQQKENKENFIPGTTIYKKKAFDQLLSIQEDRLKDLEQPYVVLTFTASELRGLSLIEFELTIHSMVREIDLVGYDEERQEVLLLLPGTSPENERIVYNRIDRMLQLKGRVS